VRDLLPAELSLRPRYGFDYSILRADERLLCSIDEMLDIRGVSQLVNRAKCRRFIRKVRNGQIQTTTDGDAALLGSLATLCFRMKDIHEQRIGL
jgi:hypothetical protein